MDMDMDMDMDVYMDMDMRWIISLMIVSDSRIDGR